jgi:hypothetical protein
MFSSLITHISSDDVCSVSGGHTRAISIATPTVGGLMKFAVKTVTCMGCKTALKPSNSVPSKWMSLVTHAAC